MGIEWVRQHCLAFPGVTEEVQWGNHLLFKIGGKMFAVVTLEGQGNFMSMKASPERFAELTDRPGVLPAPYLARAQWIALETEHSLPRSDVKVLLGEAFDLVRSKLPKKVQAAIGSAAQGSAAPTRPPRGPSR